MVIFLVTCVVVSLYIDYMFGLDNILNDLLYVSPNVAIPGEVYSTPVPAVYIPSPVTTMAPSCIHTQSCDHHGSQLYTYPVQ